jgi:nicotinate-nucleotide pyrophosphorylase (carboxylating)
MNWLIIDEIIKNALLEDMPQGDITTESIISQEKIGKVDVIVKEEGVLCGIPVFERVFELCGGFIDSTFNVKDGDWCHKGEVVGTITGRVRTILSGERTALNLMQRMSGIATMTRAYCEIIKEFDTKLLDTRKTTPGLRALEKYATKIGGATNHRYNLSDGVLIKDNHIKAAGGITSAVSLVRQSMPFVRMIEVETETIEEVMEAMSQKVDIIMLDNMPLETIREAVRLIDGKAITEVSGNMTSDTLKAVAATGVDYISVGKLTHSFTSLDISMKNLRYED